MFSILKTDTNCGFRKTKITRLFPDLEFSSPGKSAICALSRYIMFDLAGAISILRKKEQRDMKAAPEVAKVSLSKQKTLRETAYRGWHT